MILRFLFKTALLWLLTKIFGRLLPILRRIPGLFRM